MWWEGNITMSSIIIARLLGPLLLVSAAALLVNRRGLQKTAENEGKNPSVVYLDGLITFTGGLAIVEFHNLWVSGWQTIITVLGWLMVVGGGTRILIPDQVAKTARSMAKSTAGLAVGALISAVIGFILTMQGFSTPV